MGDPNRNIRRFRNRLALLLFLRYAMSGLVVPAFAAGGLVLILRVGWEVSLTVPDILITLSAALLIAFATAFTRMRACVPALSVLCSLFDKTNACGGLLMASSETQLGRWADRIPSLDPPRVHWDSRRTSLLCASASLFLAFSLLVPIRYITTQAAGRLDVGDQTRLMKEQVQVLREEAVLSEDTTQEFLEKVDQIDASAMGRDPVKTWEAMGHLQEQLRKTADQAAVEMLSETEALSQAETLAEALDQAGAQMDAQAQDAALDQLSQMARDLAQQNKALEKAMSEMLSGDLSQGKLSPEQLKELLKALQGQKMNLSESMGRLNAAKLVDLKMMQRCQKAGQCNAEGLMAMLAGCQGGQSAQEAIALFVNNPSWGVNRGPGAAPMTWTDPSSEEDTAFKEQALPPASVAALEEAQLVGVSTAAPQLAEGDENTAPGALGSAQAGSGQAVRQTILPRHKAAVQAYFKRDDQRPQ